MLFSELKKYVKSGMFVQNNGRLFIGLNELGTVQRGRKKLAIDGRSFASPPGHWHVYPVAQDKTRVYIVCPYCGRIHIHGAGGGDYEGHRVEHCNGYSHIRGIVSGYYIERI